MIPDTGELRRVALNSDPKVSVMIITYNQEQYIRETLNSVLQQDYANLEIVVADDASTDTTPAILKEYAELYPDKITPIFNETNLGITGNSNAAFFACNGDLVAIMGGDDLFLPRKISAQVREFQKDPNVVLCHHPVEIFESSSGKMLYTTHQSKREETRDVREVIERGGIPGVSSVMVRRCACPPGGFDERIPTVSDWLFLIEVALQGKITRLKQVYGKYRKHGSGASDRSLELLEETLYTLDLVLQKHPEQMAALETSCRLGKARYLAGEAYRQLSKDPLLAHELAMRALRYEQGNWRYRVIAWCGRLFSRWKPLWRIAGPFIKRSKYFLKMFFS